MGSDGAVRRYWTRSTPVDAIQYTGQNLHDCEVSIKEVTGYEVSLTGAIDVGSWVVTRKSDKAWQVLPDKLFHRIHQEGPAPVVLPIAIKTCFTCQFHEGSRCLMFDEEIDSEIHAARDCSAYDYKGE